MTDEGNGAWDRVERWLALEAPNVADGLNPPAREVDLAEAEVVLGVRLPEAVRRAYLRHDGQRRDAPWMFDGSEWLSLNRIQEEWRVWKELLDDGDFDGSEGEGDGETVRTDWWNAGWIPLTYDGSGNHHCVDMAPGPRGNVGQIIEMWHDDGARPVVATSFEAWIGGFADALEAGEYVLDPGWDALIRRT
jgi:cell wall assembly regulator SMI1